MADETEEAPIDAEVSGESLEIVRVDTAQEADAVVEEAQHEGEEIEPEPGERILRFVDTGFVCPVVPSRDIGEEEWRELFGSWAQANAYQKIPTQPHEWYPPYKGQVPKVAITR